MDTLEDIGDTEDIEDISNFCLSQKLFMLKKKINNNCLHISRDSLDHFYLNSGFFLQVFKNFQDVCHIVQKLYSSDKLS